MHSQDPLQGYLLDLAKDLSGFTFAQHALVDLLEQNPPFDRKEEHAGAKRKQLSCCGGYLSSAEGHDCHDACSSC